MANGTRLWTAPWICTAVVWGCRITQQLNNVSTEWHCLETMRENGRVGRELRHGPASALLALVHELAGMRRGNAIGEYARWLFDGT